MTNQPIPTESLREKINLELHEIFEQPIVRKKKVDQLLALFKQEVEAIVPSEKETRVYDQSDEEFENHCGWNQCRSQVLEQLKARTL